MIFDKPKKKKPETCDEALTIMQQAISDLQHVATHNEQVHTDCQNQIDELVKQRDNATLESERATRLTQRFKSLLEG